jgi:hypothetical protein
MNVYLCYEREGDCGAQVLVKIFDSYLKAYDWISDFSHMYRTFEVHVVE